MKVKGTVKLNTTAINTIIEASKIALGNTTESIKNDMIVSQVVPKRSGELESTCEVDASQAQEGHTQISFSTVYARRIYFNPDGWNIHRDFNANAQPLWMQSYVDGEKNSMVKSEFLKALRENSKGVIK